MVKATAAAGASSHRTWCCTVKASGRPYGL